MMLGTQLPVSEAGRDLDYYLDTDDHVLYGPKTAGAWPTPAYNSPEVRRRLRQVRPVRPVRLAPLATRCSTAPVCRQWRSGPSVTSFSTR